MNELDDVNGSEIGEDERGLLKGLCLPGGCFLAAQGNARVHTAKIPLLDGQCPAIGV